MEATGEIAMTVVEKTSVKSERAKDKKTGSGHARARSNSETDLPAKLPAVNKKHGSFRSQNQTMSCSSYFASSPTSSNMQDRVLTENAKYLTPEQMQALELDIFKPLDFNEILFDRMKAKDSQGGKEKEPGTFTVINWQDFIMK